MGQTFLSAGEARLIGMIYRGTRNPPADRNVRATFAATFHWGRKEISKNFPPTGVPRSRVE